jgi:hypothetical protein
MRKSVSTTLSYDAAKITSFSIRFDYAYAAYAAAPARPNKKNDAEALICAIRYKIP